MGLISTSWCAGEAHQVQIWRLLWNHRRWIPWYCVLVQYIPSLQCIHFSTKVVSCNMALIAHIKWGSYRPEAHPEAITGEEGATEEAYQKDLAYLKEKVCSFMPLFTKMTTFLAISLYVVICTSALLFPCYWCSIWIIVWFQKELKIS